ncbi:MAG: uroporphyrinogen-III C-methyltransferase [Proteobacteria bacterium]|nr:uroporphyrinogen-III C-methyltransferase [Pseudomonadota bacterium]
MDHLPIFLNVKGTRSLVVGSGFLAARKADLLLRAGCKLTVVAPALGEELARLAETHNFDHKKGELTAQDLTGCRVVFGCSHDNAINQKLCELAAAAGILVNVSDQPDSCDFIMPAVVDRSPLLVAIASGGTSPILTRMLKARLETTIPAAYGRLAEFAGSYRQRIKALIPNMTRRRRFWETMIAGPVAEHLFSGQLEQAKSLMDSLLDKAALDGDQQPIGEVYLVGTGPGDPDLLTFRALRLMQQADVVLYDRLIGDGILNLVRRDAKRIYVGKLPKNHTVSQEEIGKMLIRLAQEGKRVLRLKGGDPFVFGRGGEEIETLAENGIAFQVIPGVTAASGCAAYAGIPLTHRDHAQACIFVTGHEKDGKLDLNWGVLIQPRQTVVVYMGLSSLGLITEGFVTHGADPETPAAIIENGTREGQRVITGTLASLPGKTTEAGIKSPALIIIGSVVTLKDKLSWFADNNQEQAMKDAVNRP